MTDETTNIKSIIYHEGGDSYRPIIIIRLPENIWITQNIGYYKTSGRSNETPIYEGTWLPMGGILATNTFDLKTGHIIKMSDLYSAVVPWSYPLLQAFFLEKYQTDISNIVSNLQQNIELSETELTHYQEISDQFQEVYQFIRSYFCYEWQLRISVELFGGYWTRNIAFAEFIKGYLPKIIFSLPSQIVLHKLFNGSNNISVLEDILAIEFLRKEQSQIEDIIVSKETIQLSLRENKKITRQIYALESFNVLLETYRRTQTLLQKYKKQKKGGMKITQKKQRKRDTQKKHK